MIACVDVDYRRECTVAACLLFRDWADACEAGRQVERGPPAEEYVPGEFFRRELPHLLRVLGAVAEPLETVVIDGYVWLGEARPGLGAHLYEALGRRVPVVGVAKRSFHDNTLAVPVLRARSQRPLFVTVAGLDAAVAAACVQRMHGDARFPTLLRRVDRLCREA
ncbi:MULTISPECIES: endonuclease V [Corallococcus]|uniref:endonuclease V n=1 Tax=Corallococcus TaxID=83461 RepID=UPI00117EAE62|nr:MULTISPECIES: endonuclease V [Corallococcus]NBD11930.1 endonuclease V [Corallococcus silvisoli]TSC26085.1 endonuclease V [Corallococcus sp. Z5C101001]